jgi:aspartate racemase
MLICTNTMHLVADQVQADLNIPLIHIADVTAQGVQRAGCRASACRHGVHHGAARLPRAARAARSDRAGS